MIKKVRMIIHDYNPLCSKFSKIFLELAKDFPDIKFTVESINSSYSAVIDLKKNQCYNLPCVIKTNDLGFEICKPVKTIKQLKDFLSEEKTK